MKTKLLLLFFLSVVTVKPAAEILNVDKKVHWFDTSGPIAPYSLPLISINCDDSRIQSIQPILDTLTVNNKAEMYLWWENNDGIVTSLSFRDWNFELLKNPNLFNKCKGLYKHQYGGCTKYFAIIDKLGNNHEPHADYFKEQQDSITIAFNKIHLPENVFIGIEDIITYIVCDFHDGEMSIINFEYNSPL